MLNFLFHNEKKINRNISFLIETKSELHSTKKATLKKCSLTKLEHKLYKLIKVGAFFIQLDEHVIIFKDGHSKVLLKRFEIHQFFTF